jgi:phosphoglycolate phosphatase
VNLIGYVLWDVDGTLLRTGVNEGRLYADAIEHASGSPLARPELVMHGKTEGQVLWELIEQNGLSSDLHPAASAHLELISKQHHLGAGRREITPGLVAALHAIEGAGWANGILTGNSVNRTRNKLEGAGLDAGLFDWEHSYFGDVAPVRSDITRRAAAELVGRRIVIVGDTPGDGVGSAAAGIPFVAVATGHFTVDQLRETNAVLVIEDLATGLGELLAELAATEPAGPTAT